MTKSETTPAIDTGSLETAREEIRDRVEHFRKHQADMQAVREERWDRVTADTRAKVKQLDD